MDNERVQYFSRYDFYYGKGLDILNDLDIPEFISITINDAIEYYQIKKYFDDNARLKDWTDEQYALFSQKSRKLFALTMRFFNNLTDETIIQSFNEVDISYSHAFWELFNTCKLFERISEETFHNLIHCEHVFPDDLYKHKAIINRYGSILRDYLIENITLVKIVVDVYEQDYREDGYKLYLPSEFSGKDMCDYFRAYIESEEANPNTLDSIAKIIPSDRFPIPPELRLKSKRRHDERIKEIAKNGVQMPFGIELSLAPHQEEAKRVILSNNNIQASYSTDWLMESLDYPSILNNFLYLFEYADIPQMRCNLVSKRSLMSVIERVFSPTIKCCYPEGISFHCINNLAQLQMQSYYAFLKRQSICYEDVLLWFFTEYLQSEFGCPEMRLSFPSEGTTFAEKCSTICTTLDSAIKQFSLFVKNKEIDFELVAFTSSTDPFNQIPSLNEKKYIYGAGEDYLNYSFMLFSDQCLYSFVPRIADKRRQYATLFDLLKNEEVFLSDYHDYDHAAFKKLSKENILSISDDGKLALNDVTKITILKDLYENDVISRYHYSAEANTVFQEWIEKNILIEKGGLLSKSEAEYFNFLLNRSEYTNGLDIRNKYIHGAQQVNLDDAEHQKNYYILLIVFTILAIKINDDFCIYEQLSKEA